MVACAVLASVFLATLPGPPGAAVPADLEQRLADLWERGRASWPAVSVAAEDFARAVARSVGAERDFEAALARIHAGDLYLACACLAGDPRAIAELEAHCIAPAAGFLRRLDPDADFGAEVLQLVRQRLLVGAGGAVPGLTTYAGQGPLAAWVRVVALRTGISHGRRARHDAPLDEDRLGALPEIGTSPESRLDRERVREQLAEVLRAALGSLTPRARNVLRLTCVDQLGGEAVGRLYGVHASTISRWVAEARREILERTRQGLAARLSVDESTVDSLLGLAASIEISLPVCLRSTAPERSGS